MATMQAFGMMRYNIGCADKDEMVNEVGDAVDHIYWMLNREEMQPISIDLRFTADGQSKVKTFNRIHPEKDSDLLQYLFKARSALFNRMRKYKKFVECTLEVRYHGIEFLTCLDELKYLTEKVLEMNEIDDENKGSFTDMMKLNHPEEYAEIVVKHGELNSD